MVVPWRTALFSPANLKESELHAVRAVLLAGLHASIRLGIIAIAKTPCSPSVRHTHAYPPLGTPPGSPVSRGNRVRIPPCVVEYISNAFREPGCQCVCGGPRCTIATVHGYTVKLQHPLAVCHMISCVTCNSFLRWFLYRVLISAAPKKRLGENNSVKSARGGTRTPKAEGAVCYVLESIPTTLICRLTISDLVVQLLQV